MTKTSEIGWQEHRAQSGLPAPKKIRERGRCFCCGEPCAASDGISHSATFETAGKAFAIDLCCACKGCNGKHARR